MCLAAAYKNKQTPENLICKYVSNIGFEGGKVVLTDVLGARRSGVLALMVEPLGGPAGPWNHVLHLLQRPFKAAARKRGRRGGGTGRGAA